MGEEYSAIKRQKASDALSHKIETLYRRIEDKINFYKGVPESTKDLKGKVVKDFEDLEVIFLELKEAISSYQNTIPPFIDSLLAPGGLLTEKREISEKENLLRGEIERTRKLIASDRSSASSLQIETNGLRDTASQMNAHVASMKASLDSSKQVVENLKRSVQERELDYSDAQSEALNYERRSTEVHDQLRAADEEKASLSAQIKELKEELAIVFKEVQQRNSDLQGREREKSEAFDKINKLTHDIESNEMWIGQIDENVKTLYTNFYNTYARNLEEFRAEFDNDELPEQVLLENELTEIRKQIQALGPNINHMAVDDFEEAKKQYDFYTKQLDDLYKAKADLEEVLTEIQSRSVEMFLTTYKQISDNFQNMFRRLFGGGRAEITLQDPENVLTSGIDIFAQPPGKKLISLTLLSGGERSMTAVALLFATYLVKPSPFCILDEIDAALDDKNIGFFLSVLEDFAKTSQFIIITHNKHTVMGSTSLLGVTQMEAGVSTTVTYKLARKAGEAVILNEDDSEVDFDAEGRQKR